MTDALPSTSMPRAALAPAFTALDVVRLTGGRALATSKRVIRGAAVDSRLVEPGQVFFAVPGEHTDGHAHLADAVTRGASALVVTRPVAAAALPPDVTVVRVTDAIAALGALAAGWRRRFDPLVVGITGSIAKTSTKEAVAAVLGASRSTLKSEGNHNNEIGLPLTLLRLDRGHAAVVLEMGMYVGGEIAALAHMAAPSIGVVTAVQPVHLSRIGSLEAVERAKGELLEALPGRGTAVLNADDPIVDRMDRRTSARVLRYGFAEHADVRAEAVSSAGFEGMRFRLRGPSGTAEVRIPTLGRLSVHNAAAAAAVGIAANVPLGTIVAALAAGWGAEHRVQLVQLAGLTIVDDSYNASPGSVQAALSALADLPGRRIAVLGEMLELGDDHDRGHELVGRATAAVADLLVVVGRGAEGIAAGATAAGLDPAQVHRVDDVEGALDRLGPRLREGDVVLVKASRGLGLDRLVEALRADHGAAEP